ncbi:MULTISPECIES: proline racemase family protein [Limibacillus]|jgi:proline racemase/trans-L-3-hydroxyproline dehydratase|uniref:Proline racemase n=1 Tax=Limibacillus halophilus TaxID=1579333 RepID=A0A839STN9_9PROT|nr:proline racemase family protein [Limibacillus halophilus]MBB3064345.1 proline racemase [Limibacillus halophilus]
MRSHNLISTIDSHTGGEPTRLITGGIPIRGATLLEQRDFIRKNYDHLRAALMREPRGHRGMFGAIVCPPTRPEVDFGIVWVDHDGSYLNMCGHGTIGIGMTVVECGLVPVQEPVTHVNVDMPAGLVQIDVEVENGRARKATLTNVPSFLFQKDIEIEIPEHGRITADISFGGSFFGAVRGEQLGIDVREENTPALVRAGLAIRKALNKVVKPQHPEVAHINAVDLVTIYGPGLAPGTKYKNIHVFSDGSFDRSPGGTGTSHMMALLIGRGEMDPEEEIISEGITGSLFGGRMISRTKVGDFDAFVPQVSGQAYVTGFHQFVIDPDDPLKSGFAIG